MTNPFDPPDPPPFDPQKGDGDDPTGNDGEGWLNAEGVSDAGEERRLENMLGKYIDRITGGEEIDPKEIIEQHPAEAADILRELELFGKVETIQNADQPVTSIGDYKLLRQVGHGGMGIVYEAWEESMDRRVALKVLPTGAAASEKTMMRFVREAKVAGQLHHQCVVPVYGMGINIRGHTPYYAMEFIDGETLAQILARWRTRDDRRSPLDKNQARLDVNQFLSTVSQAPPDHEAEHVTGCTLNSTAVRATSSDGETELDTPSAPDTKSSFDGPKEELEYYHRLADAFAGVADGLQHAHNKGIIHRDIKPSNLILDPGHDDTSVRGRLRILDFGLARLEGQESLTVTGDIVGTPSYMSPEQARARKIPVDHRTDIYSLGATMYETFALTPPHKGQDHHETLSQVIARDPVPLHHHNPEIPRDLETIVFKCLQKNPDDRYHTAEALAQDLRRFTRGHPIEARPRPVWERIGRKLWRHRGAVFASAAVLLLAIIGLVVASALIWNSLTQAKVQTYLASITAASLNIENGNVAETRRQLEQCPSEFRKGWEWRHLNAASHPAGREFSVDDAITSLAFSPDGERMVTGSHSTEPRLWDLQSGKSQTLTGGHQGLVISVAFSPDGKLIASVGTDGKTNLWDADTRRLIASGSAHSAIVTAVAFSPDSQLAATASQDRTIRLWNVEKWKPLKPLNHDGGVLALAFSPGGESLTSGAKDHTVRIWSVKDRQPPRILRGHKHDVLAVAYSPQGDIIASGSRDRTIRLWNSETGALIKTRSGHEDHVLSLGFSPDAKRLVSGSSDRTLRVWDVTTMEQLVTLRGHEDWVTAVAFTPDGERIASGSFDKTLQFWDANTGGAVSVLRGHEHYVVDAAYSPDGRHIASSSRDRTVRLWDATNAELLATLRGHTDIVTCVDFSPDGKYVASGSKDKLVKVWNVQEKTLWRKLDGHKDEVHSLAYGSGGVLATGAGDGEIRIWDLPSGDARQLADLKHWVSALDFSPDGQRLASGSGDEMIIIWNVNTLKKEAVLKRDGQSGRTVRFSHDGTMIASAGRDRRVHLWDVESQRHIRTFHGHENSIRTVAFSPDDQRLISGGRDRTIRVWDTHAGNPLITLHGHSHFVNGVAFSPDGKSIVSASEDTTLRIWDTDRDSVSRRWRTIARRRPIERAVDRQFEQHVVLDRVVAELLEDKSLTPANRAVAVRIARARGNPLDDELDIAAWEVVCRDDADVGEYEVALRKAEIVADKNPSTTDYRVTLGGAQYRVGRFEDALSTLASVDRPGSSHTKSVASDLVIRALCHFGLSEITEGQTLLKRAQERVRLHDGEIPEETSGLLLQAEKLSKPSELTPGS